jgi:LysM repeat protein
MNRKALILTFVAVAAMFAALVPLQVHAGGVCGGAYTVENGDTVERLAAMCGTSTAAIFAANPGLKEPLTPGQVITIPGLTFGSLTPTVAVSPTASTATPTPAAVVNNYYNTYNYYNYSPFPVVTPASIISTGTYVVQPGDTFAGIAYSFGVSINDLWAANPYIVDINILYVGQVLNIPFWYVPPPSVVVTAEPVAVSYPGTIPNNAPRGTVRLVNKANGDVYVSLRTTRADGTNAINEYPVKGTFVTDIPIGWIDYVAWVGGIKFTGGFKLTENSIHTLTFNKSKVVVD